MEKRRPTLSEIAEAAGVSIPTVSKVLNQRPDVAPLTRQRIERVIAEIGYVHSRTIHTQSEGATKRAKIIDLISPTALDSDYYLEVLRGIEEVLNQTDYRLALFSMHDKTPREQRWLVEVSTKTTDGALLLTPGKNTTHLERLREQQIPFVVIDDALQLGPDIPSVGATNWSGGLRATEYLLALGHRRIATITGMASHLTSRARLAGYRAALDAANIAVDPDLIRPGDFHYKSGYLQTCALLALPEPPSAIFAASDMQAMGVYRALYEHGLNVPKDMSVIGFDDIATAERMIPPLTTIRQPLKEMGRTSVQMVLQMIAGKTLENKRIELATSLVIRESCAPFV